MANNEEIIREYESKKIIGVIKTASNGDRIAFAFPSYKQLGVYRVADNITYEIPSYRKISDGDTVVSLIYANK